MLAIQLQASSFLPEYRLYSKAKVLVKVVCFKSKSFRPWLSKSGFTYQLDSDLPGEKRYPAFDQPDWSCTINYLSSFYYQCCNCIPKIIYLVTSYHRNYDLFPFGLTAQSIEQRWSNPKIVGLNSPSLTL